MIPSLLTVVFLDNAEEDVVELVGILLDEFAFFDDCSHHLDSQFLLVAREEECYSDPEAIMDLHGYPFGV